MGKCCNNDSYKLQMHWNDAQVCQLKIYNSLTIWMAMVAIEPRLFIQRLFYCVLGFLNDANAFVLSYERCTTLLVKISLMHDFRISNMHCSLVLPSSTVCSSVQNLV